MTYGDLTRRTTSDKIMRDKLSNPYLGGFFRGLFYVGGWRVSKLLVALSKTR